MTAFPAAPLDGTTRTITGVAVAVLLGVMVATGVTAQDVTGRAVALVLGPLVVLLAFGYAPAGFEVSGTTLTVRRRLFGRRQLTLTGSGHRPEWRMGLGSVRKLGSGGLFGWYGAFWRPGLGSFHAYVTDRSRAVLCQTDDGPVVVSPADLDAFLATLDEVCP